MIKFSTALFLFFQAAFIYGSQPDEVLAKAGSHTILFSEFKERYTDYLVATGLQDNIPLRKSILNNMINELLLMYYDDNTQLLNNPEFIREQTWKEKQVLLAFLKDQEIHANITVTDEELRETFIRVNESISASHLYTPSEEEANQIYEMLKIGVDWDNLASQLFADSLLRSNGGYLGFFTWGDMDPAFEDAAYKLNPGEYSRPVKTAQGYSIIRVEERKPHPLLTEWEYTIKKPKLTGVLKLRKKKPAERDYINNIIDNSGLTFNEEGLNDLYDYLNSSLGLNEIPKEIVDRQVAAFYAKDYSTSELARMIDGVPGFHKERIKDTSSLQTVVSGILLQDYLLRKSYEAGYDTIDFVNERMQEAKMQVFLNYKQREILDAVSVSNEDMEKFYNDNISYFSSLPEWNLQEIIVSSLSKADSIKSLLLQGEDFGRLAGEASERNYSAVNNGETGYIPESELGAVTSYVIKAGPGEVIGPVRLEEKFGLFRIIGKREGEIKPYESVKNIVEQGVKFEKRGVHLMNYIEKINNLVKVEINQDLLTKQQIAGLN
jgi:parvulin-like peptidyl-prolyl isomerase